MKLRISLPGVLSGVPLAGFLWLMLYAFAGYLESGYFPPQYGRPDPTNIGPWGLGYALMTILVILLIAAPVALPAMLWLGAERALRASQDQVCAWIVMIRHVSTYALGTVLFATDLLRLRDWLLD